MLRPPTESLAQPSSALPNLATHPPAARPGHGGPPPASRDLRLRLGSGILRPAEEVRPGGGPEAQSESFSARGQRAFLSDRSPTCTAGPGGRDPPAAPGRYAARRRRGDCELGRFGGRLQRWLWRGLGAATLSRADVLTSSWSSWLGARAPGIVPSPRLGGGRRECGPRIFPYGSVFPSVTGAAPLLGRAPTPYLL